jgi:hypothetical protein
VALPPAIGDDQRQARWDRDQRALAPLRVHQIVEAGSHFLMNLQPRPQVVERILGASEREDVDINASLSQIPLSNDERD